MEKTLFQLEVSQEGKLTGWVYSNPKADSKAVVLICHGMAEHFGRYDDLSRYLVQNSYTVVGYDQRGHGQSVKNLEELGYMSDINNFDVLVSDLYQIYLHVRSLFPNLPIILFGHSMGSFVSQRYIELYGADLSGVVLSGSTFNKGLKLAAGRLIAKRIVKKKGRRFKSNLIHNLSFAAFNKPFKPNRTEFDWLSRDNDMVDLYAQDPYCGTVFSASYYMDLISGFHAIRRNFHLVPHELPIFIFSGTMDPVGQFGKGPKNLQRKYVNIGVQDVTLKLYEGGRHEMLNEINREEVYKNLLRWLNRLD